MSLLLDALKKAASEKEKLESSGNSNRPESALSESEPNEIKESEVLDLDLDMAEESDIYPEIDEEVEIPGEPVEEEIPQSSLKSDKPVAEEALTYDDAEEDEAIKQPEKQEKNDDVAQVSEKKETVEVEKIELAKKPEINKPDENKNKEALSELINKSNNYSRRKKARVKIIIASSLALVFFVTAGYLYLEYSVESQNIYLKSAENNPIKKLTARSISQPNAGNSAMANKKIKTKPVGKLVSAIEKSQKKQSRKEALEITPVKKQNIKIARKSIRDPVGSLVTKAYAAFNQQDYKASELLYKKAITEEPRNRDALLGLAAIAVKQQRYEYARQKYLQLRYLNPKDSLAIAGLSAIQNKINSEMSESELKFILSEQPEAAHLYFALGSIYAGQKKWADAQASFFSAWSAENTNADYAFNLAVSLDQLGKKSQAKQLYELSLKLNKTQRWSFSNQTVEKRIRALNENSH